MVLKPSTKAKAMDVAPPNGTDNPVVAGCGAMMGAVLFAFIGAITRQLLAFQSFIEYSMPSPNGSVAVTKPLAASRTKSR